MDYDESAGDVNTVNRLQKPGTSIAFPDCHFPSLHTSGGADKVPSNELRQGGGGGGADKVPNNEADSLWQGPEGRGWVGGWSSAGLGGGGGDQTKFPTMKTTIFGQQPGFGTQYTSRTGCGSRSFPRWALR